MKKFFAVLMALVLVLSMGVTVFAAGTGKITITNAVNGEDYTVYKMFDFVPSAADPSKGRYTAADKWDTFINGDGAAYLEIDADAATIKWVGENNDERKAELAKKAIAYAKANGIAGTTKTANGTTVEFENLDLGYYAIDTSLGTLCALTNTNSEYTLTEKNTTPNINKKIDDNGLVDANNVAIGDIVKYQSIVEAGKGTVNYVIHDKMSAGLTFDATSVVIVNDGYTLVKDKDYTLTTNCADGCTFEIDLNPNYEESLEEGDKLIITYSAELNEGATIGNTGNPNEIQLTYGNAQKTLWDTVITYTTKLTINKFETVEGQEIPLKGAGFTLYKDEVKDGNEVGTEIKGEDLTTFEWTGLEEGTYVLKETTVPVGYNPVKDITIVITCEEPKKVDATTDTAVWDETKKEITLTNTNGAFEGKVENKTGTLLPETGGIGTTIFYIVGITLMLGAAILLISKKKMAAKA